MSTDDYLTCQQGGALLNIAEKYSVDDCQTLVCKEKTEIFQLISPPSATPRPNPVAWQQYVRALIVVCLVHHHTCGSVCGNIFWRYQNPLLDKQQTPSDTIIFSVRVLLSVQIPGKYPWQVFCP